MEATLCTATFPFHRVQRLGNHGPYGAVVGKSQVGYIQLNVMNVRAVAVERGQVADDAIGRAHYRGASAEITERVQERCR
jgi:hypothetical protein